jgi:WD40 repeat protein/predicted Ser/Thr protein kinase
MTPLHQCEVCGTGLSSGPLGNVCPVCLLRDGQSEVAGLDGLPLEPGPAGDRAGLPREFGAYDLLAEIAHGGMGIVYRARHRSLGREVALKLLLAGAFASPDFVQRFRREAAAAASLRHPHIVGVYEVGEVEGQPFLAMEYVAGQTLADLVREHPLPPRDAARYLRTVAEAVEHAHAHGLLHRDLKPSNVLVDLDDQPRVTDFGLAKRLDGSTDLTVTGQMLGSPNYLSPEAALGSERALSPASDVYSLGATLYHLLTGRPPLLAGSLAETLVQVREQTAVAPRLLNPAIPRDLETICTRCLEKDPAQRYATARELAEELGRWLRGEPIRARPATPAERAWKWTRRHPARAALAATVVLAGAALTATSLWFNLHLTAARNDTERNRRLSETNRLAAEANAAASHERLVRMQVVTGNRLMAEGDPLAAALWFAEALRAVPGTTGDPRAELPHRRRLAAAWAAAPRLVQLDRVEDWRTVVLASRPAPATNGPFRLERGQEGAMKAFRRDGTPVRFSDPDRAGQTSEFLPASRDAREVTLNATGQLALVFARDLSLRIWNLATGSPLTPPLPGDSYGVPPQWSPDGQSWVSIRHEAQRWFVELRRVATPGAAPGAAPIRASVDSHLFSFQFDPGGRWLATAHWDGAVRLWSADTLQPVGEPLRHANGIETLAFSPDGSRLATGGWGEEARVWSVPTGRLLTPPLRMDSKAAHLAFSPDGRYLLAFADSKLAQTWDLFLPEPARLEDLDAGTYLLAVNPRGAIAAWGMDRRVHFWLPAPSGGDTEFRHRSAEVPNGASLKHLELSADSRFAVALAVGGHAWVWRTDSGELLHDLSLGNSEPTHATFSPDGRWLATASADGLIRRFQSDTGRELMPPLAHGGVLRRVAFSPDSRRLASGGSDPTVKVWDWESGRVVGSLPHNREAVRVAFNPAGNRLLTSMSDGTADGLSAQLWDLGTFQPVGHPMEHAHGVLHATFFPDGSRVLTASEESEARIWNAADGSPQTPWIRCGRRILRTEVSPDGLTVATVDEGGTLRLWDADTGELLSASAPGDWAYHAAFIGSDRVVWAGRGGPLRLLQLPVAAGPVGDLGDLARLSAGQELDATGGRAPLPAAAQLELFARLRATTPDRFAVRLSAPEWHRQEMARAATETNAFAEEFHRRALARPGP